jgi:hypothetical protein
MTSLVSCKDSSMYATETVDTIALLFPISWVSLDTYKLAAFFTIND